MEAPAVIKDIPPQIINALAAYGPFNFKEFIQTKDASPLQFTAELKSGGGLPKGLICTADGFLTGIPAKEAVGNYEVLLTATNEAGTVTTTFMLTIKPSLSEGGDYLDKVKAQVWKALKEQLPIPDLGAMYDRPITLLDIYYLLERWSVITIWDAYNLDPPGEKKILTLEGVSRHYNVYDRGSCIVGAPKDLFSYERTLVDGIQTAQALAREAHKREWTVELTGFEKLTRATWVEIQRLNDSTEKKIEVMNYNPTPDDVKVYNEVKFNK